MKFLKGTLLTAVLASATPLAALADAPPNYLGVFGSYVFPDGDRPVDPGWGWHALYGSPVTSWLSVELNAFGSVTPHVNDSEDDFVYGAGLDLRAMRSNNIGGVFALVGTGAYYEDQVGEEETSPYIDVGAGAQLNLGRMFTLRADARYYAVFNSETVFDRDVLFDARANVGLLMQFDATPRQAPLPVDSDGDGVADARDHCPGTPAGLPVGPDGCPADEDGDGVPNNRDECPMTPAGTLVDSRGCPVVIPPSPLTGDSDGDGVLDSGDRCPNTPPGAIVDAFGCPVDSDGDGVLNSADQCPDTLPGLKVDDRGCVLEAQSVVLLRNVNFEFDSARLNATGRRALDGAVAALKGQPTMEVELGGHTDSLGPQSYNLRLSQDRAASVRRFLIERGIAESRMKSEGYGEFNPVADNETDEGRAMNRRVEFKVLKQ